MIIVFLIVLACWWVLHLQFVAILAVVLTVTLVDLLALSMFRTLYRVRWCPVCRTCTLRRGLLWWACTSGRHGDEGARS